MNPALRDTPLHNLEFASKPAKARFLQCMKWEDKHLVGDVNWHYPTLIRLPNLGATTAKDALRAYEKLKLDLGGDQGGGFDLLSLRDELANAMARIGQLEERIKKLEAWRRS